MAPCPLCTSSGGGATSDELGTTRTTHMLGNEFVTSSKITCPLCMGFGEITKAGKQCPQCGGKRIQPRREVIKVQLPAGAPEGYKYVLSGVGNEAPKMKAGDIVLAFTATEHETNLTRNDELSPGALVLRMSITLDEALKGFNRTVKTLNGTKVDINLRNGISSFGDGLLESSSTPNHIIPGAGLPVFDMTSPTGKKKWVRMRRRENTTNVNDEEEASGKDDASEEKTADEPTPKKKKRPKFFVAEEEKSDTGEKKKDPATAKREGEEWEDVADWMLSAAEMLLEDGEGDGRWETEYGPMVVEFDIQYPEMLGNSSWAGLFQTDSTPEDAPGGSVDSGDASAGGDEGDVKGG